MWRVRRAASITMRAPADENEGRSFPLGEDYVSYSIDQPGA